MRKKKTYGRYNKRNIISTLAFLLESRNFNQIKLDLNYTDHSNVSLALQKGTVNVLMNEYSGIFEDDTPEEKIAKAYLLIYLEILPILFQEYYISFICLKSKKVPRLRKPGTGIL